MSTPNGFSDNPLVAEMERRCSDMLLVSQAVVTCADVFEQACEPRAPQKEWFWWLKWAHWQVIDKNGHVVYGRLSLLARPGLHRDCECHTTPTLMCWALQHDKLMPIEMENHLVLPVTEFGPTIPVGWQVVE